MVLDLPREVRPYLAQLANQVKAIEGLSVKVPQMLVVCQNAARQPVPLEEQKVISQFLQQTRILANQCTRLYPRVTIVDNKVSISSEIIERVNNGNGEFKICYADFGPHVTALNVHAWIKVMCDETGSREKHKSYTFMGQGHANYSKPEYTDKFEQFVKAETTLALKIKQSGQVLEVYDVLQKHHTLQPAKLEKVYANADYDIAKFANNMGIVDMDDFNSKHQYMLWLCSMSIIFHKIDKLKEKGPTTQVVVQHRDWWLSWAKRNGHTAALHEFSLAWPTLSVEIGIKVDVNKESAPVYGAGVFGGGGYGASDKGPHVIVDDDSGDEKKGSSFARTTPTVKIEPRADAHVHHKVTQSDMDAGKLMAIGFEWDDVLQSHDEYGTNYPARLKFCKASREKKRSRAESGDGGGASGGSHGKDKSSKQDWRFAWDHRD